MYILLSNTSIVGSFVNNGIEVVDSVGTSAKAVSSFEKNNPNVVLLDLDLLYGPSGKRPFPSLLWCTA
jgi:hypothetical protein